MVAMANHAARDSDEAEVESFLVDPCGFFESSYTAMHSIDRARMLELQRLGLTRRFAEQRDQVPMVADLASRQGIDAVNDVEAVAPLLFQHTMYKSYPLAFLERQEFGRLTDWLAKLTTVDLSNVDSIACDSIESWLGVLMDQTPLDITYSSGTSGTMSFFPWTKHELELRARADRISELQTFGVPPTQTQIDGPYHYIASPSRKRRNYMADVMTQGRADHIHLRGARRPSADLMWLASRLRLAASRGDTAKIEVPAPLLARRAELEQIQVSSADSDDSWLESVEALQGERVVWVVYPYDLYTIASARLRDGETWSFAEGSVMALVGGAKGYDLPEDGVETIRKFVDSHIAQGYGMTELVGLNFRCEADRYHLQPWTIPFVLDPGTGDPLPRNGVQRGRFAFFDLASNSHWGGLITGDEVELDFDSFCGCGATTQHLSTDIVRLSDRASGDDKIRGAATPEAYAEAMKFLTQQ
jgi:hypothetical protein